VTAAVIPIVTPLTVHGPKHDRVAFCPECNVDRHTCPGCGDWVYHGTVCCLQCKQDIRRGAMG
jgi:hypothetical protein